MRTIPVVEQATVTSSQAHRFRLNVYTKSADSLDNPDASWRVDSMDFVEAELPDVLSWISANVAKDAFTQIGVVLSASMSDSGNDDDEVIWLSHDPNETNELTPSISVDL